MDYDANVPTIEDMIADEMEANIENPNNNMIYWGNIDSDIESQQQRTIQQEIGNEPNITVADVSNNEAEAAVAIVEAGEETIEDPQITEAYPVDDNLIFQTWQVSCHRSSRVLGKERQAWLCQSVCE